uniref:Chemokine (C-X-C motif) receptor 3, tandem duplicate 1 n=1 Tax=Cyprinus carpio TaxID=7962 RepID=A0A8C2FCG1_CYPCA
MVFWQKMNVTKITIKAEDFDFYTDYNGSYNENYNESCCGGSICDQESSMYFDSIFIPVLYSVALVVGLVGNGLVLVVLWKKRWIMNATDIFILHLCLADILLLLTLPFWAVEAANEWIFGIALCKLIGALFKVAVEDTIRQDKTECVPFYPSDSWHLATRLLYHILGFILPALIMLFCCSGILLRLRRGSQCKQKRRAIRVIVALVVAFFIHWTPYNITLIIDTIQNNQTINPSNQTSCENFTSLDVALTVTSTLAYLHCCVNPVLFVGLVSQKSFLWSESVDTSHTSAS